jgi:hypothetical protein
MIKLNWGLIACGLIGVILGVALPAIKDTNIKLLDVPGHGVLTLACLAVGGAMGAVNLFMKPARWASGIAIVAFLIAGMKTSGGGDAAGPGLTGPMILAFLGILLAVALTVKPGTKA